MPESQVVLAIGSCDVGGFMNWHIDLAVDLVHPDFSRAAVLSLRFGHFMCGAVPRSTA